jgi:hypothetical protein
MILYFFNRSMGILIGLKPWILFKFFKTASDETGSKSGYRKRKETLDISTTYFKIMWYKQIFISVTIN